MSEPNTIQVRDVMVADPTTITAELSIAEATRTMHTSASTALVVERQGTTVGILTERDLVKVIVDRLDPATASVAERMSAPVVTVHPDDDVMSARDLMGRHDIRHLPVLDDGRLVGLVSAAHARTGVELTPRREPPLRGERPPLLEDFRGPWADGPPPDALEIDAPSLTSFGVTDALRFVTHLWVLAISIAAAVLRRRLDALRGRTTVGWWEAASHGAVDAFERLGPAFVKLGQLIASSPGVFPEPIARACQRTLDDVPPFDAATARRIIEEDLGHAPEALFRFFDDRPLSAASIGQVHACTLPDGRQAVIKLQRPGVRDQFASDLRILYRMAKLMERSAKLASANPVGVIEDTHAINFQELNPALEAQRQADFRANIGVFGDNPHITAPEVFFNWCGPRIICMERMYGIPMDEFDEIERRGVDGELVLRRGAKVWIESVCIHGPFHGDMHAGNIWLLDDGRSSYLDFGIMGELAPEYRQVIKDILFTCMIDGDFTRIARAYRNVGVFPPDMGTDEELGLRLQMILGPMLQAGVGGMNLGEMLKMSLDLMDSYSATAPKELVLIAKQLAYIERYAKALAPDYKIVQDLFLVRNVFPEAVDAKVAELGLTLPD